ncbi:MAG: protein kinase [Chloroflexi bacterium]|nr:protein kinase [Chloroflexota bacterium]
MPSTTDKSQPATYPLLLRALQIGWVFLFAASLFVLVGAAAGLYVGWSTPCGENAYCQATEEAFNTYGLTNRFNAITLPIGITIEILPLIIAGAFVFWQRRHNAYEVIFASMLVTLGITALDSGILGSFLYAFPGLEWLENLMSWVGQSLVVVWLAFPTGRILQPWAKWGAGLWLALTFIAHFFPGSPLDFWSWPVQTSNAVGISMIFVMLGSLLDRYRKHSGLQERQQIRWVLVSVAFTGLMVAIVRVVLATIEPGLPELNFRMFFIPAFYLSGLLLAVSLTFSILRYKLWNIDLVIQRGSVYAALTLLLAATFGGILLFITQVLQMNDNRMLMAGVLSAGVFGAAFQPLRRNIQRFVDRRFYGIEIDYQRTPAPPRPEPAAGQTAFGEFRDLQLIGRGGMAEVYRAVRPGSSEPLALKVLPRAAADDPAFRGRFRREADTVMALQHPHIVRIHETGEHNGQPFILMEYIPGHDLAEHLRRVGRLPLADALSILQPIAAALDLAHSRGIIHRDIKPSNIMLDDRPAQMRPVLMDFGIAKILDGLTSMTRSGFLGTLDYVAPEQIRAAADIDARADIYALGVMTYQMLIGELPFKPGHAGALLMAHLTQPPPNARDHAPDCPAAAARAIQRAMAKERADRFDSATEFVAALG